jgi:hypothetical protein
MKKVIYKENYVFTYDANCTNYPEFIQELNKSYKYIKKQYPDIQDKDITVEFDVDVHVPMKLTFAALETDEEYATRMTLEKLSKENMRKYQIKQLKKFLAENPELKEEFLNS